MKKTYQVTILRYDAAKYCGLIRCSDGMIIIEFQADANTRPEVKPLEEIKEAAL